MTQNLWVWHFPWQPEHTFSSASHPRLLRRLAAFNRKHAHSRPTVPRGMQIRERAGAAGEP